MSAHQAGDAFANSSAATPALQASSTPAPEEIAGPASPIATRSVGEDKHVEDRGNRHQGRVVVIQPDGLVELGFSPGFEPPKHPPPLPGEDGIF